MSSKNKRPTSLRKIRLATLLGFSIAGFSVAIVLVTAFFMFKIYDERLVAEFKQRVIAEGEEISEHIYSKLQGINNQLRVMALDNSIRVTLMLDVDYQLKERLKVHHDKYQGSVHFIIKEGQVGITASSEEPKGLEIIKRFLNQNQQAGQIFRTQEGQIHVGYTTAILHKNKHLGMAGSIYQIKPEQLLFKQDKDIGARLLFGSSNQKIDINQSKEVVVTNFKQPDATTEKLRFVSINNHSGYLIELHQFPNLSYYVPTQKLDETRHKVLLSAISLALVGSILAVLLAFWLNRIISRPLQTLVHSTQQIAAGLPSTYSLPKKLQIKELHNFSQGLIQIVQTLKVAEDDKTRSYQNLKIILNNMDSLVYIFDLRSKEILFINVQIPLPVLVGMNFLFC